MRKFLDGVMLQLFTFHSYDNLKIVIISSKEKENTWQKYRNIPYLWNNEKTLRFLGINNDDINKNKKESDIFTIDVNRNILEKSNDIEVKESFVKKYIGNHMVSIIKLKDKNISLMIDPTNLLIGIFKNGKIVLLNSQDNDYIEYRIDSNLYFNEESFVQNIKDYLSSFDNIDISDIDLKNEFGVDSQKKALAKVLNY